MKIGETFPVNILKLTILITLTLLLFNLRGSHPMRTNTLKILNFFINNFEYQFKFINSQSKHRFLSMKLKQVESFTNLIDLSYLDHIVTNNFVREDKSHPKYHVIQLNQPLLTHSERFYSNAETLLCADGAANFLYKLNLDQIRNNRSITLPSFVCGDFDSISTRVLEYYQQSGVPTVFSEDQNTTDSEKCWNLLENNLSDNDHVLILGAIGGRFDHTINNLGFMFRRQFSNSSNNKFLIYKQIVLIGESSLCTYLPSGKSKIYFPEKFLTIKCGLLPIVKPCKYAKTKGLKYELDGQTLEMSGLISACNEVMSKVISIELSDPILWYSELK